MFKLTKHLLNFGALAVALALTVSHASAQRAVFTLAVQAHVGNVTLQPGKYRIQVPSAASPVRVVYLRGDNKVEATLPSIIDYHDKSAQSYLELVNVDGTYFVDKFVSGSTGATYRFVLPKNASTEKRVTYVPVIGGAAN